MAPAEQRNQDLARLAQSWADLDRSDLPPAPANSALNPDYSPQSALLGAWRAVGRQRSQRIHIGE